MAKKAQKIAAVRMKVSKEILVREAGRLVFVLLALQKVKPEVTSDQLWETIMSRMSEKELLTAFKTFESSKKIDAFKNLFIALPQAGKDGFFKADGKLWGILSALGKKLNVSTSSVRVRIVSCRSRQGLDTVNRVTTFYALSDVKKACADLLKPMPQAGKDGFFKAEGVLWGSTAALAKKIGIDSSSIVSRFKKCRSRVGKGVQGHVLTFYALSDVKKACADLLKPMPQAGKDGFFTADGERWGLIRALERELRISETGLEPRIRSCKTRQGKNSFGRVVIFYALSDVKKACAGLLKSLPKAGKDGFFTADGERWGGVKALKHKLKFGQGTIQRRVRKCRSKKGKDSTGRPAVFYSLKDMMAACADLLQRLPEARKDGLVTVNGERWGTLRAVARKLKLDRGTIEKQISSYRHIKGKNERGRVCIFYALADVKKAWTDLLKPMPRAGKDGFFIVDGESWGTIRSLSRKLKISDKAIQKRFSSCRSRKGKEVAGRIEVFYALSDVKRSCADLLKPMPRAGKDGFFKADGQLWGVIPSLAKKLKISGTAIRPHISSFRKRQGKLQVGIVATFYALADVKKACIALLKKKQRRSTLAKAPVTPDVLVKYAPDLVRILKALSPKRPDLKSDQLWQALTTNWSKPQFKKAIIAFKKTRRLTAFLQLFPKTT